MHRRVVQVLGLALSVSTTLTGQAPTPAAAPTPLWTVTADMAAPESAYHDAASNAVFVSSINGQILEKDGNGYISRLTPEGKVVNAKWATGLNAPKGMRSVGGTLWVSDIDEVVAIDIASGKITSRVKVEGATFLNDLATAADGTVYVADSNGSRIYMVKDGKSSVFVEGTEIVEQPNGLLVDGNRLLLGTLGPAPAAGRGPAPGGAPAAGGGRGRGEAPPAGAARGDGAPPARGGEPGARGGGGRGRGAAPSGHLFAFDRTTKQRTQLTTEPVGGIDGIEPDGSGGFLLTDVFGSRLLHVAPSGAVRTLLTFPAAGADFGYIASRRLAIVPFLFGNSVSGYDLTAALR